MTLAAFKKKDPPDTPPVPKGTVVFLNSDSDDQVPMTTSEFKNGQVLCRWHDDVGNLQGDQGFIREELHLEGTEEEVEFEADFKIDAK